MIITRRPNRIAAALIGVLAFFTSTARAAAPLPSWNEGPAKQSIIAFVEKVTKDGSPDFVPPAERIAVFDNDGTLWCEQPVYAQVEFAVDRIKALAPQHPEWKDQEPFRSILAGDAKAALGGGAKAVEEIMIASHAGMTSDEFERIVTDWIANAKHPTTGRLYTEMVYQPMLEVLAYLRSNGFKNYIVSGGGTEFMRAWAERVYNIPPEQVIGSTIATQFEIRDGKPVIVRLPRPDFVDDKGGKPVAISRVIGRRPIMAFGNSDGDLQMLEWTTTAPGARLGVLVHHTDDVREVAYDRESRIGKLAKGLDEAPARGWVVIDMKNDWKTLFPER